MKKIYGIVVLYNPNYNELIENIHSYIGILDGLICVDNSEKEIETNSFLKTDPKVEYIFMNGNIGLAKALSFGIDKAIQYGANYVMLFDQDSIMAGNSAFLLKKSIDSINNWGIIAPNIRLIYREKNKRIYSTSNLYPTTLMEADWVITSGSIINIKAYIQSGGIDKKLFISGIDRDLCCRIKEIGYSIIRYGECILYQEAGNTEEKNFFGFKIHPPYLSTLRYYYTFRNELYLRKKNKGIYSKSKTNLLKYLICILFFEKEKYQKMIAVVKGVIDYKKLL